MISIAVSSRSLAAARAVDPDVSTAAVHAAVEAALAEHQRQAPPAPRETPEPGRRTS
ncbi:MAG TPA: hypothetical protein VD813_15770 [Pseudonocardia sp.]|nr:hypothetical protein [Pseudonocardia sp.]